MGMSRLDSGDDGPTPVVMPWAHTVSSPTACNDGKVAFRSGLAARLHGAKGRQDFAYTALQLLPQIGRYKA